MSDAPQEKVVWDVLAQAGLTGPDQELPPAVRLRQGWTAAGSHLRYYLNYSAAAQSFAYPYEAGTDLLTGDAIRNGQTVTLAPWDLAIVEERRGRRTQAAW